MKEFTDEQLEIAVGNYIDGLDMDTIVGIVYLDLYEYFRKRADVEETLEFISAYAPEDEE